jgi:hypothetical protein
MLDGSSQLLLDVRLDIVGDLTGPVGFQVPDGQLVHTPDVRAYPACLWHRVVHGMRLATRTIPPRGHVRHRGMISLICSQVPHIASYLFVEPTHTRGQCLPDYAGRMTYNGS